MKTASAGLIALLNSRQFYVADLFLFTLIDGTVLRYTGGDKDITYNGDVYTCGKMTGPYFQRRDNRGLCKWKAGVEVDTLQFDVIPGSATIEGFSFLQACKLGIFDGAQMTLYRAFMPAYGQLTGNDTVEMENGIDSEGLESGGAVTLETQTIAGGVVNVFTGRVVEIDLGRTMATFNVNSYLELLNQQMPRDLYQPGCMNTLFDAGCTLNPASFAVSGTVTSGSTISQVNATLGQGSGYFDQGKIVFTSGQNNGFTRTVKQYVGGGSFSLLIPLPFVPAVSDTFTAYPGCDKMQSTCSGKFSNLTNFRGQPYIPAPETSV